MYPRRDTITLLYIGVKRCVENYTAVLDVAV